MLAQAESCHTLAVWWYTQLHRPFYFLTGIWISNEQWIPLRSRCVRSHSAAGDCAQAARRLPEASQRIHQRCTLQQPQLFFFFKACFCISLLESTDRWRLTQTCHALGHLKHSLIPCAPLSQCHWRGGLERDRSWQTDWGYLCFQPHREAGTGVGTGSASSTLNCWAVHKRHSSGDSIVWMLTLPPGTHLLPSPTSGRMSTHKKCDLTICLASFNNNINYFVSELISSSCK